MSVQLFQPRSTKKQLERSNNHHLQSLRFFYFVPFPVFDSINIPQSCKCVLQPVKQSSEFPISDNRHPQQNFAFLDYLQSNEIIGKCAKSHFAKAQHINRSNFPTIAFLQTHIFLAVDFFAKTHVKVTAIWSIWLVTLRQLLQKYTNSSCIFFIYILIRWYYEFPLRKVERCRKHICPIPVIWQNVRNLEGKQTIFDRQNYTLLEHKGIVSPIIDEKIKFKKT